MIHFSVNFIFHRNSVGPQSSKLTTGVWKISSNILASVVDKIPGVPGPLTFFPDDSASREVQRSGFIDTEILQNGEMGWLLNKPPVLTGRLESCATCGKPRKVGLFDHESLRESRAEDVSDTISNQKTSILKRGRRPVACSRKCPHESICARF